MPGRKSEDLAGYTLQRERFNLRQLTEMFAHSGCQCYVPWSMVNVRIIHISVTEFPS